jgi:hypothetical protein
MTLCEIILAAYPELTWNDFTPFDGVINVKDDSDGLGEYIAKWNYSKPIPDGLTLGKPSA